MIIVGIGSALPLIIGFIFGIPPGLILALITSTSALQATASPVGVGLGLPRNNPRGNGLLCSWHSQLGFVKYPIQWH